MQPTYFINHGGGPCFFLEPGPMRAAWSEQHGHVLGKPVSGFRFG
ncbi:hypothetical protein [Cystobacter fuscus]